MRDAKDAESEYSYEVLFCATLRLNFPMQKVTLFSIYFDNKVVALVKNGLKALC